MSAYRSSAPFLPGTSSSALAPLLGLLAAVLMVVFAQEACAQVGCDRLRPEQASDYYAARGCGLLQSVEQFHLGPGREHLQARFYEAAFGDFRFILRQFPNHPAALLLIAQTCEQWKAPKCRAEEFFENAVAIKPDAPGTYVVQGMYLHRTQKYSQAIQSYKRALELDSDSLNAHYNLGLSYLETKQYELANEQAQRAYALGAQLPGLRNWLERVGHWKPLEQNATEPQTSAPSSDQPAEDASKK